MRRITATAINPSFMRIHPDPYGDRRRPARSRRRRRRPMRRLSQGLLLALLAFVTITAIPVLILRFYPPPTSAFMLRAKWEAWQAGNANYKTHYRWTDFNRIAPDAAVAVMASEDQLFPEHHGFDFNAIEKAWERNQHSRRIRGASTISQQVAKNLFLWPGKNLFRKGLEAWFTALIELCWTKRHILEVYLNIAQFGDGVYGVDAAARRYFERGAAQLSRPQAALLAAVLPNPLRLHVDRPSEYVRSRQHWILRQMHQLGGDAFLENL
jgi:monofunctional biosynthetic peptidoglycan transglycosylase